MHLGAHEAKMNDGTCKRTLLCHFDDPRLPVTRFYVDCPKKGLIQAALRDASPTEKCSLGLA